jgi:hypothetical protein
MNSEGIKVEGASKVVDSCFAVNFSFGHFYSPLSLLQTLSKPVHATPYKY